MTNIFTMVCRHLAVQENGNKKSKQTTVGYTLIDSRYQLHYESAESLANKIAKKEIEVANLAVENGAIVSTNGDINKYTSTNVVDGLVIGQSKAVILNRIEKNNKLEGYMVFMPNARVAKLNVAEAAKLASNGLVCNGKIRHTEQGDIVSAIGGNYPLMQIKLEEAPAGELKVELVFFSAPIKSGKTTKYGGALISSTSALTTNKLMDKLTADNQKVITEYKRVTNNADTDGLVVIRKNANSLYGVFSLETLKGLKEKSISNNTKLIVSVIDFDDVDADGNPNESAVQITNSNVEVFINNSDRALAAAKKYAEEIKSKFLA